VKRYRVEILPEANAALSEVAFYIRDQSGPAIAKTWLHGILATIKQLNRLPDAHAVAIIHDGRKVHSILVRPYRVYYVIDELSTTVYDGPPQNRSGIKLTV
jgi:plasmid stabilization system protein ParE